MHRLKIIIRWLINLCNNPCEKIMIWEIKEVCHLKVSESVHPAEIKYQKDLLIIILIKIKQRKVKLFFKIKIDKMIMNFSSKLWLREMLAVENQKYYKDSVMIHFVSRLKLQLGSNL